MFRSVDLRDTHQWLRGSCVTLHSDALISELSLSLWPHKPQTVQRHVQTYRVPSDLPPVATEHVKIRKVYVIRTESHRSDLLRFQGEKVAKR